VRVDNGVAGTDDGLLAETVGEPGTRSGIDEVGLDGRGAIAAVGAAACELKGAEMVAGQRIWQIRVEERHAVVDLFERTPDVPAESEVQGEARAELDVVLYIGGVGLVTAAGLGDGVLTN
jgi:hypothetical protein